MLKYLYIDDIRLTAIEFDKQNKHCLQHCTTPSLDIMQARLEMGAKGDN